MEDLVSAYHSFNSLEVDELDQEPTPLEFMRYVSKNRPFVVRRAKSQWPACQWDVAYLERTLGDQEISVAVTPNGNADSVVNSPCGIYFVKPVEEKSRFSTFIQSIQDQEFGQTESHQACVKYAQSQNNNMNNEFIRLRKDIEPEISWASVALQLKPDAVNLWIGNSRSVTDLHKDPYENVYCQVLGKKHFLLLPPFQLPCVNEQMLPVASYHKTVQSRDRSSASREAPALEVVPDPVHEFVPCATWDPDTPGKNATEYSHLCTPLRIDLEAGDLLYLPALWFHKVSQSCNEEGLSCSVNYWYDMDFQSPLAPAFEYIRHVIASRK